MASRSRIGAARRDFPFYDGRPVALTPGGWGLALLGCLLGFVALLTAGLVLPSQTGRWASVFLFLGLPLAGLRLAAGPQWTALFPPLTWRDVWVGLAFMPVTFAASVAVALVVTRMGATTSNPAVSLIADLGGRELALFAASTLPQLLGEELVTILPFLALLTLFTRVSGAKRKTAVVAAWLLSGLLFGTLHLSTYGWNLAQAFGIIAIARLCLSAPFLITKSIWSSTITHVTHDWVTFGLVLLLGASALDGAV